MRRTSTLIVSARQPRGLALIAVLWLVAALSILVTGIAQTVKSEVRVAGFARQLVQAKATGDAVMQLALQGVISNNTPIDKLISAPVSFAGQVVDVQMIPMTGYIDLNRAPVALIAAVFQQAGGLDEASAQNMAAAVETVRRIPGPSGKPARFEAIEDLMRMPGVDYALYSKLVPVLTTDSGSSGKVNVQAAPPEVLNIVAAGNEAAVSSFLQARAGDNIGADTSQMNGAWITTTSRANSVELTAKVPLPDGGRITVVRRYAITKSSADGLPWRVFYASSRVEPGPAPTP